MEEIFKQIKVQREKLEDEQQTLMHRMSEIDKELIKLERAWDVLKDKDEER